MSCTCIRSEWDADRTMITNTFELDRSCPIHGVEALESRAEGANRWVAFTDDELATLKRCLRSGSPNGLLRDEVEAELERRKP